VDRVISGGRCDGGAGRETQCTSRTSPVDGQARARGFVKHSPAFLRLVEDAKARVREISIDETRKQLESGSARVIDVREESEWAAGHIRGAEYMGRGVLERDIEQRVPDRNAELILYCGGGFRSALSADNLQKMGYTNVASMAGGWREWKETGGAVDR
jgi:rhodanese-related sulfurtransferase